MLKIGEFSKLSRVSIRMLRHYDDIGLLKPAEIDDFTGYRYYREEQLFTIGRITSLKDMGFALADIIKILDSYDDKEKMDAFLSERQMELSKLSKETDNNKLRFGLHNYGILQFRCQHSPDPRDCPGRRPRRVGRHQPAGRLRQRQPRRECSCTVRKQATENKR